jgi:hypothetical protein
MKKVISVILCLGICILFNCSNVAGTASEVDGKYALKGLVLESTGKPAEGALVRIRPKEYLALLGKSPVAADTVTDHTGHFYFDSVPVDAYTIEILQNKNYGALQQLTIFSSDSFPIMLPAITTSPTGTLTGRINLPISDDSLRPWIALYGVEYMIQAPYTQEFTFDNIPEGIYSLRIVPFLGSKLEVNLHDITVTGKCTTDVGTLNFTILQFFKGCTSFECDSTAVQMILDSNGLGDIPVDSVIIRDPENSRIVELNLSNRMITTIPKDIGSLSQLRILDLRNNSITTLPEQIGYLQTLSGLYLDNNNLYDLPGELGYLDSLTHLSVSHNNLYRIAEQLYCLHIKSLDISYNYLTDFPEKSSVFPDLCILNIDRNRLSMIPKNFTYREFKQLSVNYNRLCSLSKTISDLLDSFDTQWDSTQECTQNNFNN